MVFPLQSNRNHVRMDWCCLASLNLKNKNKNEDKRTKIGKKYNSGHWLIDWFRSELIGIQSMAKYCNIWLLSRFKCEQLWPSKKVHTPSAHLIEISLKWSNKYICKSYYPYLFCIPFLHETTAVHNCCLLFKFA